MRPRLALLLPLSLLLAGCTGSSGADPAGESESSLPDGPGGSQPAGGFEEYPDAGTVIVDGADGSYACAAPGSEIQVDPNRTYEGSAHMHDEWGGQRELIVFDETVRAGGWVDAKDAVILVGTGRVDFKLTWTEQLALMPETRTLTWTMPGDGKLYKEYSHTFQTKGSNHSVPTNLSNNDPPHYKRTTWSFHLSGAAHLTITIFRGYDCLPIDPPHYDYWGQATQKELSTTVIRVTEESVAVCAAAANTCQGLRQPGSGTFPMAGKNTSVPPGTKRLEVTVSWRNDHQGVYGTKIRIEYQTASTNGATTAAAAHWKRPTVVHPVSATSQTFEITPGPEDWDSPYDLTSSWRFKWYFDASSAYPMLGNSGIFKGEITFVFTAHRD